MQLTYPGTKISTLGEVFDFVRCVDKKRAVKFNIESKVNPVIPGSTRSPEDFVAAQYAAFVKSGYPLSQITVGFVVCVDEFHRLTFSFTVPEL
jgi:hypothetical protein